MDRCELVKGYFREALARTPETFAPDFVLIDSDYYTSARDVFEILKDRLPTGTVIYFDDLGTNFYNRLMGEERLIDEVNKGLLGDPYHLHHLWDRCFVWSNATKPVPKSEQSKLDIPLRRSTRLENFY